MEVFTIGLSPGTLTAAANERLHRCDASTASAIAEDLVELHPRDSSDHLLLGRAYECAGRVEDALEAYERAYALAVENGSQHLAVFSEALEAIRKKIGPRSPAVALSGARS